MAPRKLPTPKDHFYLDLIKQTRYQVGTRHEMHKPVLQRGMPSRASVRWYLKQCGNNVDLASWMCLIDRELILSMNDEYCAEILQIATSLNEKYGKLSTVYNKAIARECDELYSHIYQKYEVARQERVRQYKQWVDVIDPDGKLYKYGWCQRKKTKAHSRSKTRRLLNRVAEKLLSKYGLVEDNPDFRAKHWNQILNFESYVYSNLKLGYDASLAFKIFE